MRADRRLFLVAASSLGAIALSDRAAAAPSAVDPTDPQARMFGYTPDVTKIAPAFAPRHTDGARCGDCAMFQGKSGDAPGPCPIFGGKLVQNDGWCSSWVKKA